MAVPESIDVNSLISAKMARLNITDLWLDAEIHATFWHSATGLEALIITTLSQ